jgi:hypothetical protein
MQTMSSAWPFYRLDISGMSYLPCNPDLVSNISFLSQQHSTASLCKRTCLAETNALLMHLETTRMNIVMLSFLRQAFFRRAIFFAFLRIRSFYEIRWNSTREMTLLNTDPAGT